MALGYSFIIFSASDDFPLFVALKKERKKINNIIFVKQLEKLTENDLVSLDLHSLG